MVPDSPTSAENVVLPGPPVGGGKKALFFWGGGGICVQSSNMIFLNRELSLTSRLQRGPFKIERNG